MKLCSKSSWTMDAHEPPSIFSPWPSHAGPFGLQPFNRGFFGCRAWSGSGAALRDSAMMLRQEPVYQYRKFLYSNFQDHWLLSVNLFKLSLTFRGCIGTCNLRKLDTHTHTHTHHKIGPFLCSFWIKRTSIPATLFNSTFLESCDLSVEHLWPECIRMRLWSRAPLVKRQVWCQML